VAEPGRPAARRRGRAFYWVLVGLSALAVAGGGAAALTTVRTFTVPSSSMENTIRPGDLMLVDTAAPARRGEVIIDQQPPSNEYFIRRVIGLPGDRVACCDAAGRITVNGKALHESYLYPGAAPSQLRFHVTVPRGKLWLLGDNRLVALDSRELGPQAVRVIGRVFLVVRSGHATLLRTPPTFVADGLAPAGSPVPPALIAAAIAGLGLVLLVLLIIIGAIRHARAARPTR
jgi:signal peptidase I